MIKFYRNTRLAVLPAYAETKTSIDGIVVCIVKDTENKGKYMFFNETTGICLCEGTRSYCFKWIHENSKRIKELLATPKYKQFAEDIQYQKEIDEL